MKNCKNCGTEFQPKHETRGHEQLYCSIKCRNEAYKKRVNEKQQTQSIGNMEKSNDGFLQSRSDNYSDVIGLLEKLGEAKTEVVRYQLKCEALEKENTEMRIKISQLEMELDSDDDDEEENPIISGIVSNFQKDPMGTLQMINKFLNMEKNAKAATT